MIRSVHVRSFWLLTAVSCSSLLAGAQPQRHGRGYKAPPATAEVTVKVEKSFNEKALPNASVVFRSMRDGKMVANLETKTDPDGKATLDLLEVGTHVTVQVIAGGFSTYATDFDLTEQGKQVLVKLKRPQAQVSQYEEGEGRPSTAQPGIQEHRLPTPSVVAPAPPQASPTAPLQTTPPIRTPAASEPSSTSSPKPELQQ